MQQFKVGQKIKLLQIPGTLAENLTIKLPVEVEIVAVPDANDAEMAHRVIIETPDSWYNDPVAQGWQFNELPGNFVAVNAKKADAKIKFTSMLGAAELVDARGIPEAQFGLNQMVRLGKDGKEYRIIGWNAKNETYVVEDPAGEKLSMDMVKKMDVFSSPCLPAPDGSTSVRCRLVSERDIVSDDKVKRAPLEDEVRRMRAEKAHFNTEVAVTEESFWDTLKGDAKEGLTRAGANQIMKAVHTAFIKFLQANSKKAGISKAHIGGVEAFFRTELGQAVLSEICGYLLTYIPGIKDNGKAKILAKEFRVQGIEKAGNIAADTLVSNVLPNVLEMLQNMPDLAQELQPLKQIKAPAQLEMPAELLKEVVTLSAGNASGSA